MRFVYRSMCDPCAVWARVRPCVPCVSRVCPVCVPCVSRVCPGSPRCLFTYRKKTPGGAGTHKGHTDDGSHRAGHSSHNHPDPQTHPPPTHSRSRPSPRTILNCPADDRTPLPRDARVTNHRTSTTYSRSLPPGAARARRHEPPARPRLRSCRGVSCVYRLYGLLVCAVSGCSFVWIFGSLDC